MGQKTRCTLKYEQTTTPSKSTSEHKNSEYGQAYEKKSRDHEARQKGAKQELIELLAQNGRRSYSFLGKAINSWCSISTIERFFKSLTDFQYYSKNVRPLLSEGHCLKQVAFAQHVQNRWGLGIGRWQQDPMDNEVHFYIFLALDVTLTFIQCLTHTRNVYWPSPYPYPPMNSNCHVSVFETAMRNVAIDSLPRLLQRSVNR